MGENSKQHFDLGDTLKRMDAIETTYGSQHLRGEDEKSSENSTEKLKQKLKDIQSDITEALRNPKMKKALKIGAMLLLASQLMHASDTISETDGKPTPDQLPSLIEDYTEYLQSDRAVSSGVNEGLNTLIDLAKEASNNPFPKDVQGKIVLKSRVIAINQLPIQVPYIDQSTNEPKTAPDYRTRLVLNPDGTVSFQTGAGFVKKEKYSEVSADPAYLDRKIKRTYYSGNGEKTEVDEPYRPEVGFYIIDTVEPNAELSAEIQQKLDAALQSFGTIELTLNNGSKATIDGIKVTNIRVSGPGTDDKSAVGFTVEFTSTKNPHGDAPISYGGFSVSIGADGNILRVRQQENTYLPEKGRDFADKSIATTVELLHVLGQGSQLTFAEFTQAGSQADQGEVFRYNVDSGVVSAR